LKNLSPSSSSASAARPGEHGELVSGAVGQRRRAEEVLAAAGDAEQLR
jgi:hypothetical protein